MRKDSKLSFIEEARRKQIISTSVESIASRGYSNTSLADIAKNAGISKSVISYYFKYKDNLIKETAHSLLAEMNDYVKNQVNASETATEKLRAYVTASFDFIKSNRKNFMVTLDIGINVQSRQDDNLFNLISYDGCHKNIEKILVLGQQRGEFKEQISLGAIVSIVQGSIDGIGLQWVFAGDSVPLEECRDNLVLMLECLLKK